MSDIQDLIHTNAVIAYEQGRKREQERIINLIKQHRIDTNWTRTHFEYDRAISEITRLIKGEAE